MVARGTPVLTFFVLVMVMAGSACGRKGRVEDITDLEVTFPNGNKVLAEAMYKDMDLIRGMMHRDVLPDGRAMILMEPTETPHPVITYNCRIPLDLVWMDKNQRVVEISEGAQPCTLKSAKACPLYGGKQRSRYVLEMNAGVIAKNQLKVGDKLQF
jgi:uncharacterized protein